MNLPDDMDAQRQERIKTWGDERERTRKHDRVLAVVYFIVIAVMTWLIVYLNRGS